MDEVKGWFNCMHSGGHWGHWMSSYELFSKYLSGPKPVSGRFTFVLPWVGPAQAHLVSTVKATRIKSNPKVYTRNGGRNQNWNAQPMNCLPHRPWNYWCPLSRVILDALVLFLLRHMLFSQHIFLFLKEIWVNFLLVLWLVPSFMVETVYESLRNVLLRYS